MNSETLLPEIDYGCSELAYMGDMDIPLNVYESELLKLAEKTFTSEKREALAVIKKDGAFKIIRSRKPYILETLRDEELSNILSDYNVYLDFLFVHGVDEAFMTDANLASVEIMIKSLVSYFDMAIAQGKDERVVRIDDIVEDYSNRHILLFRPEDIRISFDADFLKKVKEALRDITPSENSKNKIGIQHLGKTLKNTPRPKMKILEQDPYISNL